LISTTSTGELAVCPASWLDSNSSLGGWSGGESSSRGIVGDLSDISVGVSIIIPSSTIYIKPRVY
jgi:hypothetical protein